MTNAPADEPVYFDAVLRPNRSLGPRGFALLMGAIALASFATGVAFLSAGAWPVLGFFGLDVLLIYIAFRASYRSARGFETVRLTAGGVEVRRVDAAGRAVSWRAPAHWLRVDLDKLDEYRSRLVLRTHGRACQVGAFLAPEERAALAAALAAAVGRLKRGEAP
jgi:uncharacterized membrane protein